MRASVEKVIADLEKELASVMWDSEYHLKKFKQAEEKIVSLKETLDDLKKLGELR